jgi:hypothetical protein
MCSYLTEFGVACETPPCQPPEEHPSADELRAEAGWSVIRRIINAGWLLPLPSLWSVARGLIKIYVPDTAEQAASMAGAEAAALALQQDDNNAAVRAAAQAELVRAQAAVTALSDD